MRESGGLADVTMPDQIAEAALLENGRVSATFPCILAICLE